MNGLCAMGRERARPDLLASVAVATRSVLAESGGVAVTRLRDLSSSSTGGNQVPLSPPDVAGDGPKMPEPGGAPYASRT